MNAGGHPVQRGCAAAAVGDKQPLSRLLGPKNRPPFAQTLVDEGHRAAFAAAHRLISMMAHLDNGMPQIRQQPPDSGLDLMVVAQGTGIVDADLQPPRGRIFLPFSAGMQELVDRLHRKPVPVLAKNPGAVRAGGHHGADAVAGQKTGHLAESSMKMRRSP